MLALSLLLVEDEPGIREGLASYLRLKGHRVVTADSCRSGVSQALEGGFDLVVTDWNLGDGLGAEVIAASEMPVLVISGVAESVDSLRDDVTIISKPVIPQELVARIESMAKAAAERAPANPETANPTVAQPSLPRDARDRVDLIKALVRERHDVADQDFTVEDDGSFVTLRVRLGSDDDLLLGQLLDIGGDVRCLDCDGEAMLEARFFRDGRRDETDQVIPAFSAWPEGTASFAVDFSDSSVGSPSQIVELIDRIEEAVASGRSVYVLNVPTWVRMHLEILGKAHAMPNIVMVGPRLPEVLSELWR